MQEESQPPDLDSMDAASIAGRRFGIWRSKDITGKSGTGWVMAGIVFSDGSAVTRWINSPLGIATTTVWGSVEEVLKIHEHGGGDTQLVWMDSTSTRGMLVPEWQIDPDT